MPYPSILDQRKAEIAAICRRHKVSELALFGSAAKGNLRSDSDLDFLVEFAPGTPIGLLEFGKLQAELEAALQRRVDLVSKRGLKRHFGKASCNKLTPSLRDDRQRLADIVEASKLLGIFQAGRNRDDLK